MFWLQSLAWLGLLGVAAPILIHLLARQRSRRVLFPSLQFLPRSQTAALRRRAVADWPLLIVRVLIIALATVALAGPVFISDARRASWNQRVARAFVVAGEPSEPIETLVNEEAVASVTHASFASVVLADALTESVEWLRRQPPAAREIVVLGPLRQGALNDRDFDVVPPFVGLRFLPTAPAERQSHTVLDAIAERPTGEAAPYKIQLNVEESRTRARYELAPDRQIAPRIRLEVGPSNRDYADALLRAVLRDGLLLGQHAERRVTLAFPDAETPVASAARPPTTPWVRQTLATNAEIRGGEVDGALVARVDLPVTDSRVPRIVASVLQSAFTESLDALEPRLIPAATLARWSRAPGPSPAGAMPTDEGDRRWVWAVALVLLGLEQVMRARGRTSRSAAEGGADREARVA